MLFMRKSIFFIFALAYFPSLIFAQKNRNSGLFLEAQITQGGVIKSNAFVKGENKEGIPIDSYSATDLRVGWQTTGKQVWHHHHKLPYYGVGIHSLVFSNEEEIGYPNALYFFFGGPFSRKAKSSFDYEFSFGLSSNWKPYDAIDNPFNVAIGSYNNAYIDARIKHLWYFSKRFSLDTGIRVTHFSNGAIKLPNSGINLIAPTIGIRYDVVARNSKPVDPDELSENILTKEFNVIVASGKRSVRGTETPNQKMVELLNVSLEHLWPSGNKYKYGLGLDVGIDENRNLLIEGNEITIAGTSQQIFGGVSAIGQFRANRLGVQAEIGTEMYSSQEFHLPGNLYQRIGLRYYLFDNLITGINIKAKNFSVADYIEWSLGFSFPY